MLRLLIVSRLSIVRREIFDSFECRITTYKRKGDDMPSIWNPPLRIVDAHCDTLWQAPQQNRTLSQRSQQGHLDIPRMQEGGVNVQFFALFSDPDHAAHGYTAETLAMIERFYEASEQGNIQPLLWREDVAAITANSTTGLLSIEGAEPLHGRVETLRAFFRLGVRAVGLTWNYRNDIADGQLDWQSGGGLTAAGIQIVHEMERLGMLIDCSHLSDASFWSVMEHTKRPLIASHSNARAVCRHLRNVTDEQIVALAERSGVIGITLAPSFLTTQGVPTVDDVLRHIDHIAALVGTQHIGLGSDFDGIPATPSGLEHAGKLAALADALLQRGYKENDVRNIMGESMLRLLVDVLPSCPDAV